METDKFCHESREVAEPRVSRKAFLTHAGVLSAAALVTGLALTGCDQGGSSSSPATSAPVAIDASLCTGCGDCVRACTHGVLAMNGSTATVASAESCTGCGHCLQACRAGAITVSK